MTLLLWLTLAYTAVLVLTLAAGLTAVWLRLRGIDRALEAAHGSLTETRDATSGLHDSIEPVVQRLMATVGSLEEAAGELREADERVQEQTRIAAGSQGQ